MKQKTFTYNFHKRRVEEEPLDDLLSSLKGRENLNFLEIGCCEGQSTDWFIQNFLQTKNSTITCIDPFYQGCFYDEPHPELREKIEGVTVYDLFRKNILDCYPDKVKFHRGESKDVLPTLKKDYYDFIYVDGNHKKENVRMDCELSWDLLKDGGLIMYDDYCLIGDVREAIDEFLLQRRMKCNILTSLYLKGVFIKAPERIENFLGFFYDALPTKSEEERQKFINVDKELEKINAYSRLYDKNILLLEKIDKTSLVQRVFESRKQTKQASGENE